MDSTTGSSHILKVMKIESYEDVLNSLRFEQQKEIKDLFDTVNESVANEYLIKYMLETESKGSLLSTDNFKKPFNYEMDIATDSAVPLSVKTSI